MIKKKNEQAIISTSIQISEQNTKWGIDIKEYLKTTFLFEFVLCLQTQILQSLWSKIWCTCILNKHVILMSKMKKKIPENNSNRV